MYIFILYNIFHWVFFIDLSINFIFGNIIIIFLNVIFKRRNSSLWNKSAYLLKKKNPQDPKHFKNCPSHNNTAVSQPFGLVLHTTTTLCEHMCRLYPNPRVLLTKSSSFLQHSISVHCFIFVSVSLLCACVCLSGLVQRCVIIQKDENGFGLTVSGDNPVFVQLVKEGKKIQSHYYPRFALSKFHMRLKHTLVSLN